MSDVRGLPLLSGPPPPSGASRAENACRRCNREFNVLFLRSRKCNHCGHPYCSSCTDYQALMPRSGPDAGYVAMPVCAYCIEFLNITAAGRGQLKSLPLSKLIKYVDAYNIDVDKAVEKDNYIDAIIAAKGPNGCLKPANEDYYRNYSVPDGTDGRPRGIFSRPGPASNPTSAPPPRSHPSQPTFSFPRPDLEPDNPHTPERHPYPPFEQEQSRYAPPPGRPPQQQQQQQPQQQQQQRYAPPQQQRATPSRPSQQRPPQTNPPAAPYTHAPQPQRAYPPQAPYQRSASSHSARAQPNPPAPRQRATSAAPPHPPPPPPTLDELLAMTPPAIGSLSIGTLKALLFSNHVNTTLINTKEDLVAKVLALVANERDGRERQRVLEAQEEEAARELQHAMMEEHARAQREREEARRWSEEASAAAVNGAAVPGDTSPPAVPPPLAPTAQAMAASLERTGLCVICQDEEANIAIVDCGHLAMCRGCSDLVMGSSRECPLCRTRIVTEARLLRIFKT